VPAQNVEAWIPEEWDSDVIMRINQNSVVESVARNEPMSTETKKVPRSGGAEVAAIGKSQPYPEGSKQVDNVLLTARKLGHAFRFADEDIKDSTIVDVIRNKQLEWATSYAKYFDNATLGVTGTESDDLSLGVPFTSVYKAVRTAADIAAGDYVADANYIDGGSMASTGAYDLFSDLLATLEGSDYFDPASCLIIAHPAFRSVLRKTKTDSGDPIFVEGQGGTPNTLFGYSLRWSMGARTSATATEAPTGNPLVIAGNANLLIKGNRSAPESMFIGADTGVAALTDEAILKVRARRGFAVGHPAGFAVLEKTA
jgi:HK97 family phage major capsid protein